MACTPSAYNPPIQMNAASTCAIPEVRARAWSPRPAPCPPNDGSAAATRATTSQLRAEPVEELTKQPMAITKARSVAAINARVAGISFAYVAMTAGFSASMRVRPKMFASAKSICTTAKIAHTQAAIPARIKSRRPAAETTPPLPAGSRTLEAKSQPMVAMAAKSVINRSIGVPHTTRGPESGKPGAGAR
ncbi:unannotated protein [freshwater metagenome]|uniref:Unannotated protein n=1 Tax=freshwater metagenome TaxID=449393 RepID=A0A6J7H1B2_9ZZZZ